MKDCVLLGIGLMLLRSPQLSGCNRSLVYNFLCCTLARSTCSALASCFQTVKSTLSRDYVVKGGMTNKYLVKFRLQGNSGNAHAQEKLCDGLLNSQIDNLVHENQVRRRNHFVRCQSPNV